MPTPVPYNDRAYRWVKDDTGSIVVPSSLGIIGASTPAVVGFGSPEVPAAPILPKPTHLPSLPPWSTRCQRQAVGLIDGYRR